MRGKPSGGGADDRTVRITPADAGKTKTAPPSLCRWWDHPRGCGENLDVVIAVAVDYGSPPRMRGKRFSQESTRYCNWITPADAGKTYSVTALHRRVKGSPPRMRGKQP